MRVLSSGLILVVLLLLALPVSAQTEPTCESLVPENAGDAYYIGLADAYTFQGNYSQAIFAYNCAIERSPDYAPAYVNRGLAHAAQFNFPTALDDYNRALELDANLISAYLNRGVLYSKEANYALAIADFTFVTLTAPDNAAGFHNRALVHAAEGNYDLAIEDLQQAIALDPDYAEPHQALSAIYLALALESGARYEAIKGLPADTDRLLNALIASQENADPSVWFVLQTSVQE